VRQAAADGAQVILLQELFATPYFCIEQCHSHQALAEPYHDSPLLQRFAALAGELGVVLPLSWYERAGNAFFNSLTVADADGRCWGVPQDPYPQRHRLPGEGVLQPRRHRLQGLGHRLRPPGHRHLLGPVVPETARCLALMGAEVLLFPTAIGSEPGARAGLARPLAGHARPCRRQPAAGGGRQPGRRGSGRATAPAMRFYGSSFICDHKGALLAEADRDSSGVWLHDLDLARCAKTA
jgi:N-carbamoylputrescine amidase